MVEDKREEPLENWDAIFDSIKDPVFIIDNSSTIRKANRVFVELIGKKKEDVVGKKCYELLHKLNHPWPECPFEETKIDNKAHAKEVNDPNIGIPLLVTTSPIFDKAGQVVGVVHAAKDITEIKHTEDQLRKKIRDLEIFYKAAIDREMRIKELKKRVAEFEGKDKN